MRRTAWLIPVALALAASVAFANVLKTQVGTWKTCASACTTGASDPIDPSGASELVFQYIIGAGAASFVVQECLADETTCNANSLWTDVLGSSSGTTGYTDSVTGPSGIYRVNVQGCSGGCTYTVRYRYTYPVAR